MLFECLFKIEGESIIEEKNQQIEDLLNELELLKSNGNILSKDLLLENSKLLRNSDENPQLLQRQQEVNQFSSQTHKLLSGSLSKKNKNESLNHNLFSASKSLKKSE